MLGFREHQANTLLEEDGRLTGKVAEPILGRAAKAHALEALAARLELAPADAIAGRDGANDLDIGADGRHGRGAPRQTHRRRRRAAPRIDSRRSDRASLHCRATGSGNFAP